MSLIDLSHFINDHEVAQYNPNQGENRNPIVHPLTILVISLCYYFVSLVMNASKQKGSSVDQWSKYSSITNAYMSDIHAIVGTGARKITIRINYTNKLQIFYLLIKSSQFSIVNFQVVRNAIGFRDKYTIVHETSPSRIAPGSFIYANSLIIYAKHILHALMILDC